VADDNKGSKEYKKFVKKRKEYMAALEMYNSPLDPNHDEEQQQQQQQQQPSQEHETK
jgi:hypothetical protein